ncbi:MurR/RpiR family transcriptional regulator [Halanaerocella petrolearia]
MRLQEVINNNYNKLNDSDLHILEYILNNKQECSDLGINDLAQKCNVSRTTIFRLAKKLGFKGYSEFKFHLKWEEKETDQGESDYITSLHKDIDKTIKLSKEKNFTEICKLLYDAQRIFIYSTGTAQTAVARELKRTFLVAYKHFHIIESYREFEVVLPSITKDDVVLFISLSGNTTSFQSCINEISMKGIPSISITSLSNNQLSHMTDHNLYVAASPVKYNNSNIYPFSSFFILIERLFGEYIKYQKEQEE